MQLCVPRAVSLSASGQNGALPGGGVLRRLDPGGEPQLAGEEVPQPGGEEDGALPVEVAGVVVVEGGGDADGGALLRPVEEGDGQLRRVAGDGGPGFGGELAVGWVEDQSQGDLSLFAQGGDPGEPG